MTKWIAERRLKYSERGSNLKVDLSVKISSPYLLEEGSVNFEFAEGTAGCTVKIIGPNPSDIFEGSSTHEVYGIDSIQALQLASDIEPTLKRLSKKYDIYSPGGEPYFEE